MTPAERAWAEATTNAVMGLHAFLFQPSGQEPEQVEAVHRLVLRMNLARQAVEGEDGGR